MKRKEQIHPPKTRMTFNVGITGHVELHEADQKMLVSRIDKVLEKIKNEIANKYEKTKAFNLYVDEPPVLRMISMLAEGSDRIVAECALKQNFILQCPLPMAREEYKNDFGTEDSKNEFDALLAQADSVLEIEACAKNRSRAYQNSGQVMLGQIDLLLAVWKGIDSDLIGGTSDIVDIARHHDIPVIWIHSKAPHEISFLYGEMLSKHWEDETEKAIGKILLPWNINDKEQLFSDTYFKEKTGRKSHMNLYNNLKALLLGSHNKKVPSADTPAPEKGNFYKEHYLAHYNCADDFAQYYRDIYRSCGVIRQLLPFFASIGLALGFYTSLFGGPNGAPAAQKQVIDIVSNIGFMIQAICFVLIIFLGKLEKKSHWHQKSMDYRALAELLRQMEYLSPAGLVVRGLRTPAFNKNVSASWINWQFRAISREAGLPSGRINKPKLGEFMRFLDDNIIHGQLSYHDDNSRKMDLISLRIESFGRSIYYASVLIYVVRVVVHIATSGTMFTALGSEQRGYISTFFNMLSMVVPLFSSLAFGLSSQEGFGRIKQLSEVMIEKLQCLSDQAVSVDEDYHAFMKFSQSAADLMLSEFTDWNVFFQSKIISSM